MSCGSTTRDMPLITEHPGIGKAKRNDEQTALMSCIPISDVSAMTKM